MMLTSAGRALFVLFATAALVVSGLVATPGPAAQAAVVVSDWDALKAQFAEGGARTVVLGADITGPVTEGLALVSGDDVVLDLNDHALVVGDADDDTRTYGAGIAVPQGAALVIQGGPARAGALTAFGGWYSAGIGGTDVDAPDRSAGSITIESGTITARGGQFGAGIGGGLQGQAGIILISGGTVTAGGGQFSAGIGGGHQSVAGGSVTISGGAVTARGAGTAAGIGGGNLGTGIPTTITGGTVDTAGGASGAGIGGGRLGDGSSITISGGQVLARGSLGSAAVGAGGHEFGSHRDPGTLTIIGSAEQPPPATGLDGQGSQGNAHGAPLTVEPGPRSFTAVQVPDVFALLRVDFTPVVTFDAPGGIPEISVLELDEAGLIVWPADPARPGQVLTSWHLGTAVGPVWNFATDLVEHDLTLVGVWEHDTPVIVTAPAITGGTGLGSVLSASTGAWDLPTLSYSYQWLRDGSPIDGATGTAHTIVEADLGRALSVAVTAARAGDARYVPATAASAPVSVPLGALQFLSAGLSGEPELGAGITASLLTSPPSTLAVQWLRDGSAIGEATGTLYTPVAADVCHGLSVQLTASRPGYGDLVRTLDAGMVAYCDIELITGPTISGTPRVGQTLTASGIVTDPAGTITYQWLRDGQPIAGATGDSYQLVRDDADRQISVRATVTAPRYADLSTASAAITIERATIDLLTPPTITGTAQVGHALTAEFSTFPAGTAAYQWQRNGAPIPGATGPSHLLVGADHGAIITVQLTVSAARHHDLALTAVAGDIEPGIIASVEAPVISGIPGIGHTLAASPGTWAPSPGPLGYAWLRNGVPIPDATGASYLLTRADHETVITVAVTASVPGYHDRTVTTASVLVDAAPAHPVPPVDDEELTPAATGDVAVTAAGRTATLTLPEALRNQWLYVYGHSAPVGLGWFRAPSGTLTVPLAALAPGEHRLALLDIDGELAGWVPITVTALPDTGASGTHAGMAGAGVLLLGGVIVLIARRKRRA